ncbi:MAG TPA: hypothetical protein VG722_09250 [Tepidisphaeraceae bacterium]|nr:hypothetical protein [Tepidisphaeraceae bacterium]
MRKSVLIFLLVGFLAGCTTYEYQLEQPAAKRIVYHHDESVKIGPLVYDMWCYENHLIVWIHNPTKQMIELLGDASTVDAPDGISHPVADREIAAEGVVKLVFPPVRPAPQPTGPMVGIGVEDGKGPVLIEGATRSDDEEVYWDWKDSGRVRMNLVFRQGENTFTQTLVFQRVRAD